MIKSIRNQKGIALVTTLLLLVLGFAVVAILLRLTTQATKLAGLEQGYTTALDAAKAGADDFIYMVQNYVPAHTCGNPPIGFGTASDNGQCLQVKLYNATASWAGNSNWDASTCGDQAQATSSDPTLITTYPDITLSLQNYKVSIKLIDTYLSAPTDSNPCYSGCYYYTVLAWAQARGSKEHAEIQFVYRYDQ